MAPKRARTKANAKANPQPVDRISKLPDPVIHRILSLVPTIEVVRMSLLSKHWRRMWYSVPAVNFSDADRTKYFPSSGAGGFYNCVNKCLKHRKAASRYICDSVVTRFRFHVECPQGRVALDKCLDFAIRSNAEEIDVRVKEDMKYRLPQAVLNIRSLSVLKLDNLILDGSYSANTFPALKHLSLIDVELRDELLEDLISVCPSLESFFLKCKPDTRGAPSITSSTLKFMEIETSSYKVYVQANNLVSLKCHENRVPIDISACKAIRNLWLVSDYMVPSVEDMISRLPALENLRLGCYDYWDSITIRGQNLKSISLENNDSLSEADVFKATIEAPNLTSFSYEGLKKLSLSLNLPRHPLSSN